MGLVGKSLETQFEFEFQLNRNRRWEQMDVHSPREKRAGREQNVEARINICHVLAQWTRYLPVILAYEHG